MFFVKKPTGCVFPFQRSPLAKDYNRHAYQWLPAPLEAPKLPGEFTLNDGHHFFYANEVSKGDEIHIRWESQFFFLKVDRSSGSAYFLLICIFLKPDTAVAVAVCSFLGEVPNLGRTHEVHPTAVHGSVSKWWVPRPFPPKNPTTVFLPQNEVCSNIAFPQNLIFL